MFSTFLLLHVQLFGDDVVAEEIENNCGYQVDQNADGICGGGGHAQGYVNFLYHLLGGVEGYRDHNQAGNDLEGNGDGKVTDDGHHYFVFGGQLSYGDGTEQNRHGAESTYDDLKQVKKRFSHNADSKDGLYGTYDIIPVGCQFLENVHSFIRHDLAADCQNQCDHGEEHHHRYQKIPDACHECLADQELVRANR